MKVFQSIGSLPSNLEPNSHYYVRVGSGFDHYITDNTASPIPYKINQPDAEGIASGSTLGLEQAMLASSGQVGLNVLAVGYTNTGKVQGVSLGDGNVVEVYSTGSDFSGGVVLHREFMSKGEPICFTGLSNGSIITSTAGFYGGCEAKLSTTHVAFVPLLSLGLSFKDSFMFSFRESERTEDNHAFLFIVNGPIESEVQVTFGDGSPIADQPAFTLAPWEFGTVHLDGNTEYRMQSSNSIMVCTACGFDNVDFNSANTPAGAGPRDARVLLPTSNDVITHPRTGQMSAPFAGTSVNYYSSNGAQGAFTLSPGSPLNIQTQTGQSNTDYRPDNFTRFRAVGLVIGHSGADGAGGDATPAQPVSTMSQVVAQPLFINDSGNGDQSSVTIFSPYVGTARILEWDNATSSLVEKYVVPLNRLGAPSVNIPEDQFHPTAGQVSNEPDAGVITLNGTLKAGLIEADVPIGVIAQTDLTPSGLSIRTQGGGTTSPVDSQDDESLMFGITPFSIAAEIRQGEDGLLYRRSIPAGGTLDNWLLV